jgi:ATP phosphoribosyltransferase
MTTEERLRKLEDALTVEAQLLDRHERLDEERHARIDAQLEALAGIVGKLGDRQLMTQASLDRLTEQIDRFLRGRSGNGGQRQD